MGRLDNKVAIITGAGSGIGKASAIMFAKEGAKVVVVCRTVEDGDDTVRLIKDAGGEATYVKADVSEADEVKKMIKITIDTYGRLDILFNNAGGAISGFQRLEDSSEEDFDRMIAVNLKGVWLGMKFAIPEMLKLGGGSIINTSSASAVLGTAGLSSYSATKGGIDALSRAVAVEFGARNVRVNIVSPAICATRPMNDLPRQAWETMVKAARPRGVVGQPEEVAYAALFLASDEASDVTGAVLAVDGGTTAKQAQADLGFF